MFKEVKIESIPKIEKGKRNSNVVKDIRAFYESGIAAGEVKISKYKNPASARATYSGTAKNLQLPVIIVLRGKRLFMIRGEGKTC